MRSRGGWLVALLCCAQAAGAATAPSFEDLVSSLKSPNARTRQDAAAALGKSRRREAITPLVALVRDPDDKVRLEMVKALRQLRDVSAMPTLVTAMADGDAKVREESIGTLVEIYADRERSGPVDRFLEIFSDDYERATELAQPSIDPSVLRALGNALKDEEKSIRSEAAYALGILDGVSEVKTLISALQDVDPGVRGAAATAIGKVGTSEDGKALVPILGDENANVRKRVLRAIGILKVREAGPALRDMYEANKRRELGLRVLDCLSRIGDPGQADLFRDLVQDPDPDRKRLAVEGLGRISDASMLPAFKKDYQRERNEELRLAYSFALTLLGDRAFLDSIILGLPSKTLGNRCRDYVLEMGRPILPDLYPYLNDPDAEIRSELCEIIGALNDPDAIPHLEPLVNDPSAKVADRANRALGRLRRTGRGA